MDDSKQEFRIGLMTIVAIAAAVVMVFRFGDIGNRWKQGTRISIVLPNAAGVFPDTPVRLSGIAVGRVESLKLVAEGRGVMVTALIEPEHSFRNDSRAMVSQSLLGDGAIEIIPGRNGEPIAAGDRIVGQAASDPLQAVARLEQRVNSTLTSFEATGKEWSRLGNNLNQLLESRGSDGVSTIERSTAALEQFSRTMKAAEQTLAAAGNLIGDPRYQQQLQATLQALPELLNETRTTLTSVNSVIGEVDKTVSNINTATTPLAENSEQMITRLNRTLANVEVISNEMAAVSQMMNRNNGSLKQLMTDPSMYRNLNATASSMTALLKNLEPVIADLQVFSDKVARHPELLGVRGVVKGSDGSKGIDATPVSQQKRSFLP